MEQSLKDMLIDLRLFKTSAIYFCKLVGNNLGGKRFKISYMNTAGGEQFAIHHLDYIERTYAGFYSQNIDEILCHANELARKELNTNRDFDYDWVAENWEEKEEPMYEQLRAMGRF